MITARDLDVLFPHVGPRHGKGGTVSPATTTGETRRFAPADLDGRPPEVARYFRRAVAPGTPVASAVHLRMRGRIRVGGLWLPFRAEEIGSSTRAAVSPGRHGSPG